MSRKENKGKRMKREELLENAKNICCNEREDIYGNPENNFNKIAGYWNETLSKKLIEPITGEDAAKMMCLMKIARMDNGKFNKDNYIDAAAYIALAFECRVNEDF